MLAERIESAVQDGKNITVDFGKVFEIDSATSDAFKNALNFARKENLQASVINANVSLLFFYKNERILRAKSQKSSAKTAQVISFATKNRHWMTNPTKTSYCSRKYEKIMLFTYL